MPSLVHTIYARASPRLRCSGELRDPEVERRRQETRHSTLEPTLPGRGLASTLDAEVVRPHYPPTPEHTWPGLVHVVPILPALPEAARAWRRTMQFLA